MLKSCYFCVALLSTCFTFTSVDAQEKDVASLKETYLKWIDAWNNRDIETIGQIAWPAFGFGRDVPFLRSASAGLESYKNGLKGYMELMADIGYKEYFTDYRIIDSVGLVNGFYEQTTQQKNGPSRTVYGRQSLVFVKRNGQWQMIHYHRSELPNEFVR